jgi:hypothetical protein
MADTEPPYEKSDADLRVVAWFAASIVFLLVLAGIGGLVLTVGYRDEAAARYEPAWPRATRLLPPRPRLEVERTAERDAVTRREVELLEEYGWVDRESGIVRMPIDEAAREVAERGLPRW